MIRDCDGENVAYTRWWTFHVCARCAKRYESIFIPASQWEMRPHQHKRNIPQMMYTIVHSCVVVLSWAVGDRGEVCKATPHHTAKLFHRRNQRVDLIRLQQQSSHTSMCRACNRTTLHRRHRWPMRMEKLSHARTAYTSNSIFFFSSFLRWIVNVSRVRIMCHIKYDRYTIQIHTSQQHTHSHMYLYISRWETANKSTLFKWESFFFLCSLLVHRILRVNKIAFISREYCPSKDEAEAELTQKIRHTHKFLNVDSRPGTCV